MARWTRAPPFARSKRVHHHRFAAADPPPAMPTMAAKRDYYEVLGVSKTASDREIRDAYRKLAIKYHPDHSSASDAAERFKEAAEAFEVLGDPQKRARYDQFGH